MIDQNYTNTKMLSSYQPSSDVCDLTKIVKDDYGIGDEILHKTYIELNNRNVIDDENRGQLMFNAFVDTDIEDESDAWKWIGTRSMARNKAIAMHANLTANYLLPMFNAQNEDDETDRNFSEVMRDIIEWMASPTNSNYQSSFLQIVFGMMHNPVTYLGAEYNEVFQTIKERQEDGTVTTKELLDMVLSGFQAPIYSSSQILITNAYERNIQKQRSIIKRRYVEKSELEAKYGKHPNWEYVQEGVKSIYSAEEGVFFDYKDDEHPNLIAEETWSCRRDDTEVCFINGIYMGDDDVEANPINHRDNRGAPKYNVIPFGYSRIGEHFFFYKSLMNSVGWDNDFYDGMSRLVMNRAVLEVEMPYSISGIGQNDKVDSDIVFPSSVVTFESPDTKINPLLPGSNMVAGFNALRETENSMNDATVNETISGNLPAASQKAYSVAQAQASGKKLIQGVGKSLGESICQYGDLMKDIALNHITIPQVDQLVGDSMKLKYRSFVLPNKNIGGKKGTKKIQFDDSLIGAEMTEGEKKYEEAKMLEDSGYPDNKGSLVRINPELFARFNYLSLVDPEEMFAKNADYWQPVLLNLKQALVMDPYTNQEALTSKLMEAYFQSEGENLVQKNPQLPGPAAQNQNQSPFGEAVQKQQLSTATTGALGQ